MSIADSIKQKLTAELSPSHLEVIDESHLHSGHVGARPEGETHFKVIVVSREFQDLSRVACQRRVHRILSDELRGPVHALSVSATTK